METKQSVKKTLTIIRGAKCYFVRSTDQRAKELFGTDTLPLPFLPSMPIGEVIAEIAKRNPGCEVVAA